MKNLTLFYIKKRLPIFLIVLGIMLAGTVVYLGTGDFYGLRYYYQDDVMKEAVSIYDTGLSDLTFIALALATIVPIYEFSFKMKKNGCDLFYSLPIKRSKLYLFKYIFGICEMLAILFINFIIVITTLCIKFSNVKFTDMTFTPGYYFLYLLVISLLAIVVFSWVAFFYTRANTFFDGLISVVASSLLVLVVVFGINVFGSYLNWWDNSIYSNNILNGVLYSPYGATYGISNMFDRLVKGLEVKGSIAPSIIGACITAISIPLFITLCGKESAEESEDISDSIFIYKTMLPIFIISTFMLVQFEWGVWVGIIIAGYIGYVIYNRNFKLKKYDWIAYASSVGLGFILMMISTYA